MKYRNSTIAGLFCGLLIFTGAQGNDVKSPAQGTLVSPKVWGVLVAVRKKLSDTIPREVIACIIHDVLKHDTYTLEERMNIIFELAATPEFHSIKDALLKQLVALCNDNLQIPLRFAATRGYAYAVSLLLEAGVNLHDPEVLARAIADNQVNFVKLLLDQQVNPNMVLQDGNISLDFAMERNHLEVAKLLFAYNAKTSKYQVFHLFNGSMAGIQGSLSEPMEEICRDGDEARQVQEQLLTAAQQGNDQEVASCIAYLKKKGIRLNMQDNNGLTALMSACNNNQEKIVCLLIKEGADLEKRTFRTGKTALILAVIQNNSAISSMLLDKRANPHVQTAEGETALNFAKDDSMRGLLNVAIKNGNDDEGEVGDDK